MKRLDSKKFTVMVLIIAATMILALAEALSPTVGSILTGTGVVYLGGQSYVDGAKQ